MNTVSIMTIVFSLWSSQSAVAAQIQIGCQFGQTPSETFIVAEVSGNSVTLWAQDDDLNVSDFHGQLTNYVVGKNILIEARAQGLDAPRFLVIEANTDDNTIHVKQTELKSAATTYHCKAIR